MKDLNLQIKGLISKGIGISFKPYNDNSVEITLRQGPLNVSNTIGLYLLDYPHVIHSTLEMLELDLSYVRKKSESCQIELEIEKSIGELMKSGSKVPYTDAGIKMITEQIDKVLSELPVPLPKCRVEFNEELNTFEFWIEKE